MTPKQVKDMLKSHYEKTGRIMSSVEMIIGAGIETEPASLIKGVRMFDKYLDLKRAGAA